MQTFLGEKGELLESNHKIVKTLNNAKIQNTKKEFTEFQHEHSFVMFRNHTSIKTIKKNYDKSNKKISFQPVSCF